MAYTPMMEQYLTIKAQHQNSILMFRLGDFYEIFFEDAKTAARELDIALTGRDCGQAEKAPMCGVPHHAAEGYINKLVEKGYHVAIADQVEEAKPGKLVKREVVRVVTPGTITDANFLEEGRHNYIVAIYYDKKRMSLAAADITTGLFITTAITGRDEQQMVDELVRLAPAEIIVAEDFPLVRVVENVTGFKATTTPAWTFHAANTYKILLEHFGTMHLEGFGITEGSAEVQAAGALLTYLTDTQKNALSQITKVKLYSRKANMLLDASSRRNLELTMSSKDKTKRGSLLWVIDQTKTAMGARVIRNWVDMPLMSTEEINKRLNAVEEWLQMPIERAELREYLYGIHDLERVMSRLSTRYGTARDMAALRNSLKLLPQIERLIKNTQTLVNSEIRRTFDDLADIYSKVNTTIGEALPPTVREGNMIKDGFNKELDRLRDIKLNAKSVLEELEAREKSQTGITSLKVRFNRVFGYYIEVTTTNLSKVPAHYIRRQTLANCERFVTEELKNLEETILGADEKIITLEFELFDQLRREIVDEIARIQFTAQVLATLDTLQSLAEAAEKNNYVKPIVNNSNAINIKNGRHPVVEKLTKNTFIPNDTVVSPKSRLSIITGPNMAGKSTYMRQVALITLMAQIGSFVPAESAEIGVCDHIFTRVGASDDLATGQSTFMVEMTEVANILNNATESSLVLLDEIGRGTSTFDGLSIAWAVLDFIAQKILSKTLFATHYHELTQLENQIEGVTNYSFTAEEQGEDIVFLRKLIKGEAGQSYGIHVARLAGLPSEVLTHANDLLEKLTTSSPTTVLKHEKARAVKTEIPQNVKDLINELGKIEIDKMTPLEALMTLGKLKEKI